LSAREDDRNLALIGAIDDAEEHSYGSDSDSELSTQRARAINYYLGRMPGAPEGRSQVVDRTVYETVAWMKPSLARIFANSDNVVEIPPVGPDDEESAKQEGEYLNFQLLQKNNWFEIFNTACTDALVTKAGYLWAYAEDSRQVEPEKYERQTQESVALIMQDKPEVVAINEYPDPDFDPAQAQPVPMVDQMGQPVIDPMTGQPVLQPPQAPMLYDLEIRRTKTERKYCVVPMPPERVKVAESHNEVQLQGCSYFEYYDFCTISYLRTLGLEVPDDISESEGPDTEEDQARDQYAESSWDRNEPTDSAMRRVKTRWIWIAYDYDQDGISELNHVIRVGQTILHREEVNEIPVGVLCPDPLPHRHVGLSVADSAIELQDISTSILRQGMDNLYLSNNPRQFGDPTKVNLDDMLVSRPGGITRTKTGAVFMQDFGVYQVPNVFPQAVEALEYLKQKGEDRTGVGRYFQGTDKNALNTTASGINQLTTMSAQRVEQIARYFANGVEALCRSLHALILKGGHRSDVVKLRGKWVTVDPSTWRSRKDFRICVGYSAGNKDAQMARLTNIAMFQEKAMQGGLPIVRPENVYETAIEITKASDFSRPERFWTDPANIPPPPPPQPDVTVMAMEQIKSQTTLQAENIKATIDKYESDNRAQIEKYKADLQAEVQLALANQQAQNTREVEGIKAQNAAGLKMLEGDQTAALKEREIQAKNQPAVELAERAEQMATALNEALSQMQQALSKILTAKRQIRRGKNGKAEAVDIVDEDGAVIASQKVLTGPDGRISGTQ
jgi:hypothetical protein